MSFIPRTSALPVALLSIATIAGTWYKLVSEHVPDPYLDEVFHVPQAQRYCKHDYSWDPKITTPAGLYLVSLALKPIIGCDTTSLRLLNVGGICGIYIQACEILKTLRSSTLSNMRHREHQHTEQEQPDDDTQLSWPDVHSALNISLFPPLFFFSGLYYTDVMSTLLVLMSHHASLRTTRTERSFWSNVYLILLSIAALSFRQTNIFWVAVLPAGLAAIDTLKTNSKETTNLTSSKHVGIRDALGRSWNEGRVWDCALEDAGARDYALLIVSVALAALRVPLLLLKVLLPFLTLLGFFASFVAWNGGVVLGDKSNHIATIHLPQLLYLWPYMAFFSLPLVIPTLIAPLIRRLPDSELKSFCLSNLILSSTIQTPGVFSFVIFLSFALAAVHYNTIVHPFTLADNRHYVFYVFRNLRRHWAIKYLAAPLYYLCAWMTIQTVGSKPQAECPVQDGKRGESQPTKNEANRQPCQISFILIWLVTTALSVISAPLVEPRYFIMPWIIWRLHVPTISALSPRRCGGASYDMRLVLETVWHLAIHTITAYLFLHRGFSWPREPGRIQRFLY